MDEVSEALGEFFDQYWGERDSIVYVPVIEKGKKLRKYVFQWPKQRAGVIRHVLKQNAEGNDAYFAPAQFKRPETGQPVSVEKEAALGANYLWADFDGNAPEDWSVKCQEIGIPEPSLIVKSSVDRREHAYWRLDEFSTQIEKIEDANRAIAYRLGGDTSGWDVNQLLRPPYTSNFGYRFSTREELRKSWYNGEPVPVTIERSNDAKINLEGVASLGTPERAALDSISLGEIPDIENVLAFGKWTEDFLRVFRMSKEEAANSGEGKRSGALMSLAYFGAENGMSDEQIYSIVDNADKRWEKYTSRSKSGRHKIILDTIARARAKHGYLSTDDLTFAGLLGEADEETHTKIVYSLTELLELEVNLEWLIEDLLHREGIGLITGQPGVGKTQLGIQLALHIAGGSDQFLKWKNLGGERKVLFLSLEMATVGIKKFMESIAGFYDNHEILNKNFHVAPLDNIMLDRIEGQQFLENLVSEYKPDVLFIDSLQKTTTKELTDELASKALLDYFDRLRTRHGIAIYGIHHDRKRPSEQAHQSGDLNDMYGSQYLSANVDFVIRVARIRKDLNIVSNVKNRYGPEMDRFYIKRNNFLQYIVEDEPGDMAYDATFVGPTGNLGPDTTVDANGLGLSV